jgi:hypothetical protein
VERRSAPQDPVSAAGRLQGLLGLSDDELLAILDEDPLAVITGELDHRPELPILLDLLADAEERAGAPLLRRWVRAAGPAGRPLDLLLARDFGAFEDALAALAERGFVLRGGGVEDAAHRASNAGTGGAAAAADYSSGSGRCSPGQEPVR